MAFSASGMAQGLLRSMAAITRGLRRPCSTAITARVSHLACKRSHILVEIETGAAAR
jgi:hypothetical protein